MSYERTPFGQRLYAARKRAGLSQKDVAKELGLSQGTISELERHGQSSGHVVEFARLYGVPPDTLAVSASVVAEPPATWTLPQPPNAGAQLKGGMAQLVSQPRRSDRPTVIQWESIMSRSLPPQFSVRCPDDSMAPFLRPGHLIVFDSTLPPSRGDIVLVQDASGTHYVRLYRPRSASAWEAKPLSDLYQSLDSERDGLRVRAVYVGMEGRLGDVA